VSQLLVDKGSVRSFEATLRRNGMASLRRAPVSTLQVNVGLRCDLACHHCHVEAGPKRTESMNRRTVERILEILEANSEIRTLDLTGGAPELCEHFRTLVSGARALSREVIDRCNLTVLFQPGQEDTAMFLAESGVRVVASLPCYTKENVDQQRGRQVFERSIEALRILNGLGYAKPASGLELDLVYNPLGPTLPPDQEQLEGEYRVELQSLYGIAFNRLLTIANMPIKRFAHALARDEREAEYMSLLVNHFNPDTVSTLMCRHTVSVGWGGEFYDCDFNQMLEIPLANRKRTIWDLDDLSALEGDSIATDLHCHACTAGAGSSCGGALAADGTS